MPTAEEAAADAAPGHGREGGAQPWAQAAAEEEAVGTTGNRVFTESWKLRREPNLQLSVKPLFAEPRAFYPQLSAKGSADGSAAAAVTAAYVR
jgi:hypothetical protein